MEANNRAIPALIQELHKLPFDYLDGEGIDFEPYQDFLPVNDAQDWFIAWTGNVDADATPYLIFGQDGTGGYAVIWLVRDAESLLDQPVVFFGSEGEMGVIAVNFSDYLWLLASGHGPMEAVSHFNDKKTLNMKFIEFAKQHATTLQRKPSEILSEAQAEFPDFETNILSLCK